MRKPFVAIVDDDSAFAAYLRTFLSLRGYEARTYSRGDEMLAAIRQGDPPDVVLLDVMMPGLDGLATLRALKAARPETQAIMLSGREQASIIVATVRICSLFPQKRNAPSWSSANCCRSSVISDTRRVFSVAFLIATSSAISPSPSGSSGLTT